MAHPLAGRKQSLEHVANRIAARRLSGTYTGWSGSPNNKKRITSDEARRMAQTLGYGPGHPRWAGNEVGSAGAHHRAKKFHAGKPCQECGETRYLRMALITGCGTKWDAAHGMYSPDPADYIVLCAKHHQLYDNAARRQLFPSPGD